MSGEALKALNEGDAWDFRYEDHPRCPHCAHSCDVSHNDWYQLYEEGEHDVECPICEQPFTVSTHVKHSFSTDEQDLTA